MSILGKYLEKIPDKQKPLIERLDEIIQQSAPSLQPSLKWGNLTYHNEQNICAIVSHKNHLNVQFFSGTSLDDPQGWLEGTGKNMRHIKIRDRSDIDVVYITNLVQQATTITG